LILTTFGQGNLRTVFGSIIAGHNENKRGEYLGISASIMSLSMIIGPLIATVTYATHPGLPFMIAGILGFFGWGIMKFYHR
jgi:MFS family permease